MLDSRRMNLLMPILFFLLSTSRAMAQGGPPLLTDDPGTPGNRNWEINTAWQATASSANLASQTPQLDLNYGAGDQVQLNLQIGYVVANQYGEGPYSGLSAFSVGTKWRFVDEDRAGIAISTYPRLDFHGPFSSGNERINTPGSRFFLPAEFSKELGRFGINPEIGYAHFTRQADEWDFGLASSYEVEKEKELLAEVHVRRVTSGGGTEALPQIGSRWAVAKWASVIDAFGRSVQQSNDEPPFWSIYFGAQLRL